MALFRPSKPLRGRFFRIFGPSRPLKPRISLERVDVFEVFTIFSSHSLFSLSLASVRPIFGFPGHLSASSREPFFWPEGERGKSPPPSFLTYMCPSSLPISQMVPPERQNDPKTSQIHSKMRFKSFKFGLHRDTSLPFFRPAFQQFNSTFQELDNKH